MSDQARYRSLLRETAGEKLGATKPVRRQCMECGQWITPRVVRDGLMRTVCDRCWEDMEGYMERPGQ